MLLSRLKPYPNNPRKNDTAIAKVAAQLKAVGWKQPIVVDPDMVIVVGHTRWLAARSLGLTRGPVHVARGYTPAQLRAYRLADNRTADEATWDEPLLREELRGLKGMKFDLTLTGFDDPEITRLMAAQDATPPTEFVSFDAEIPVEHQCPKCGYEWSGKPKPSAAG